MALQLRQMQLSAKTCACAETAIYELPVKMLT